MDSELIKAVVCDQMKAARKLRGLSLRVAAMRLGISASYLAQIEGGKRNLSLEVLFAAARAYKVSLDVLLGREQLPGSTKGLKGWAGLKALFNVSGA